MSVTLKDLDIFQVAILAARFFCLEIYMSIHACKPKTIGTDHKRKSLCLLFHLSSLHIQKHVFFAFNRHALLMSLACFHSSYSFYTLLPIIVERRENKSIVIYD